VIVIAKYQRKGGRWYNVEEFIKLVKRLWRVITIRGVSYANYDVREILL